MAGAAAGVVLLGGCAASARQPTASPTAAIAEPSSTPTTAAATPTQTSTPSQRLAIGGLRRAELAEIDATAVCDPVPSQANIDAGESTVVCTDAIALAVAVIRTVTRDPVVRVYLRRPPCVAIPCSADQLDTAEVIAWTSTQTLSIQLDSRLDTVPLPSVANDAVWPAPGGEPEPAVRREAIKGAPHVVADREPYPYCGRAETHNPASVLGCFRDAVLAGRRAEMIDRLYGTEGGELLVIYRYDGHGRLIAYEHDQTVGGDGQVSNAWRRAEGAMNLGITPLGWDFEPWWGTDSRL